MAPDGAIWACIKQFNTNYKLKTHKMSKKRFRLSEKDTVKATLSINGQLVASLYDSGFSTKNAVFHTLCRKVHYSGMLAECHISVADKMISTSFNKKVI